MSIFYIERQLFPAAPAVVAVEAVVEAAGEAAVEAAVAAVVGSGVGAAGMCLGVGCCY